VVHRRLVELASTLDRYTLNRNSTTSPSAIT
jgi:hypothetical protein